MQVLRFLMLLALVVWIGGIVFVFFVVAPAAFSGLLPTHDLAGRMVGHCLNALHWMGIVSGVIYLLASLLYSRFTKGFARPFAARNVVIALMIILTAISLFAITPKMDALKSEMGIIDNVPQSDSRRMEFNRLHGWSMGLESAVLLLGLGTVFLTGKTLSS